MGCRSENERPREKIWGRASFLPRPFVPKSVVFCRRPSFFVSRVDRVPFIVAVVAVVCPQSGAKRDKSSKGSKKADGEPKNARGAYACFVSEYCKKAGASGAGASSNANGDGDGDGGEKGLKGASVAWKAMSDEAKDKYEEMATVSRSDACFAWW